MTYIAIKTNDQDTKLTLVDAEGQIIDEKTWQPARTLSNVLLDEILQLVKQHNLDVSTLNGIIIFKGPGSFTGLRIGVTIANALSHGLTIPVVATQGENWLQQGIMRLQNGENDKIVLPDYGADAHITLPRK